MKYIFLIAAFNALFYVGLILRKEKARHDRILIAWLMYLCLYTGAYAFLSRRLFTDFHLASASFVSLLMLHGPFMYFYISALIDDKFRIHARSLLHFIPPLMFNAYLLIGYFYPELMEGIRLDHVETGVPAPFLFNFFLFLTVISGPVYFYLSIRLFKKLDINIFNNFSTSESVNLGWLRNLVNSFGAVWTLLMVVATIHHVFHLFSLIFCTDGLFLSLSVFIILIGYFGLSQKEIFVQYSDKKTGFVTEPKSYATPLLNEPEKERHLNKLDRFMAAEKPYLDPNITLPELAAKVHIPSHHLSRTINEKLGLNFFEYINQYRIEEVKEKMSKPEYDRLTLLGIAYESGFNTKSAFNRVFKKMTGLTPTEYKKMLPEQKNTIIPKNR